jgi:hypothetical protein
MAMTILHGAPRGYRPRPQTLAVVIHTTKLGTLPRVIERVRSNPKLAVGIACGVVLVLAWIAWAVYVGSDNGSRSALGVLIAWPALLAAIALVSLPFIGGYRLIRHLSAEDGGATAEAPAETDADADEEEEPEEEEPEEESESDEEAEDDGEDETEEEAEASAKS